MSINRFPLRHKNWYWNLIFIVNLFIPGVLAFMRLGKDFKGIESTHYISISCLFLFMVMTVIYVWATFREYRVCAGVFKKANDQFTNFIKGISCTFLSIFLSFVIIFVCFSTTAADKTAVKVLVYVIVSITAILGIISNVFLNMFEFKLGFEVFYRKYKDTLFKDIVDAINKRKRVNRSYSRYR